MAIHPSEPEIEVKVVVDGQDAVEYAVDNPTEPIPKYGANQLTRYIESKSGKNFYLQINVGKKFDMKDGTLSVYPTVDGNKEINCPVITSFQRNRSSAGWEKFINGTLVLQRFMFSPVTIGKKPLKSVDQPHISDLVSS